LSKIRDLNDIQVFEDILWDLKESNLIYLFVNEGVQYISSAQDYISEKGIAKHVWRLSDDLSVVRERVSIEEFIRFKKKFGTVLELTDSQYDAVNLIMKSNFSLLIGAPGTGKTFTVKTIIEMLQHFGFIRDGGVGLAAPTGIAAKILDGATGILAQTVHRMLKFQPETNDFYYNDYERLEQCDLIIVDEISMLDVNLANSVLKAVANKTQVVFIGDKNQLPSVDKGAVLRDLMLFPDVVVAELTHGRRFSDESGIGICAKDINNGMPPSCVNKPSGDFYFKKSFGINSLQKDIVSYFTKAIEQLHCELDDIQVLTPKVVGELGSANLSKMIKAAINPSNYAPTIKYNEQEFSVGDRVVLLQNMYTKNVYNGDIGKVISVTPSQRRLVVEFKDEVADFVGGEINFLTLAYAISVHKSQGSQFPIVLMPFHQIYGTMLYRSLVYTGVTRAQKAFIGLGDFQSLAYAARVDNSIHRKTTLLGHLTEQNFRIDQRSTLILT